MRRYFDYLPEEISKFTDEELKKLIDLEIAHAGIIPEEKPIYEDVPKIEAEPTVQAYELNGVIFKNIEDAQDFQNMEKFSTEYLPDLYNYKYLVKIKSDDYCSGIKKVNFYDKKKLSDISLKLKNITRIKNENESKSKHYQTYLKSIETISNNVYNAYRESIELMRERVKGCNVFKKHLELADNNREVAEKFFRDAYKDYPDIIEYVLK